MGLGFDRLRAVAKRGQVILVVGRQVALRAATPSPPPIWSTSSQWSAAAGWPPSPCGSHIRCVPISPRYWQ